MVHLPTEILHPILWELHCTWGVRIAPLATVNHHWQSVVENILWENLSITTKKIESFISFTHGRYTRQHAVRSIYFEAKYFQKPAQIALSSEGTRSQESDGEKEGSLDDCDEHSINTEASCEGMDGRGKDNTNDEGSSSDEEDNSEANRSSYDSDVESIRYELIANARSFWAFRTEHMRFMNDIYALWTEIASWDARLRVREIKIVVHGWSMYKHLGPGFRDYNVVQHHLHEENWLNAPDAPLLPVLHTVEKFIFKPEVNTDVGWWTAIVGCHIASSLAGLEDLEIRSDDWERRWSHVRRECREILARQIKKLPSSLKSVLLWFEHHDIYNQAVEPEEFLVSGVDNLSRALRQMSRHLTKLFLNVNQISSELFWPSSVSFPDSDTDFWPNMEILDVRTGQETALGDYWLRELAGFPNDYDRSYWDEQSSYHGSEPYSDAEEERIDREIGMWPVRLYRVRPEPESFTALANSIARAALCMPKLAYMNMELDGSHRINAGGGWYKNFKSYRGWSFYFRSGNKARFISDMERDTHMGDAGIDWTDVDCPRTEWVFQVPYGQIHWEEPEEAKELWRSKFASIDMDLVTLAHDEHGFGIWERRREGKLIQSSAETYDEHEPLAVSLTDCELLELVREGYRIDALYETERLELIRKGTT